MTLREGRGRIWRRALAAAAALSTYYVVEGWLIDIQAAGGRVVMPTRGTLASVIPTWLAWAALAPALVAFFRRHPLERHTRRGLAAVYLGAAPVVALVHGLLSVPLFLWGTGAPASADRGLLGELLRIVWWSVLRAPTAIIQFLTFAVLYHAVASWRAARARDVTAARLREALARAELDALKLRLEPHFLFNTLNAISSYIRTNPPLAERMVAQLSRLLRAVLELRDAHEIRLAHELSLVSSYLEIQRLRFGERLCSAVEVERGLEDALVPSLVLQPLVENAVHFGLSQRTSGGRLEVRAVREADSLRLLVVEQAISDDERGRASDAGTDGANAGRESSGNGIGLSTTRSRLEQLYGPRASVTLVREHRGSRVDIVIPYHTDPVAP